MSSLERAFVSANRAILVIAFAIMFGIVMVNVIGRYVFGTSFAWVEETARYLMIFGTFAGAGLALREGRLVAIDFFVDLLPQTFSRFILWAGVLVMGIFACTLVWYGAMFAEFGWNKETMATGVPKGLPYLAIPVGMGLFVLHLLLFARRYVNRTFLFDDPDQDTPKSSTDAEDE